MVDEINVTAIARETGLNHTRVKIHLKELCDTGVVQEKSFGRIRIYQINDNYDWSRKIKKFLKDWSQIENRNN